MSAVGAAAPPTPRVQDGSAEGVHTDAPCPACGERRELELGVCLPCAGRAGDGLAFVVAPRSAAARRALRDALRAIVPPGASHEAVRLTAAGCRALAAVPLDASDAVTAALAGDGIPTRVTRAATARAPLPPGLAWTVGAAVVTGGLAGWLVQPALLWVSPLFGALLWLLAQVRLRRPVIARTGHGAVLPRVARTRVVTVLAALPPGAARDLLADIVRLGVLLEGRAEELGDPDTPDDLAELMDLAAETARELARLDDVRQILLTHSPDLDTPESARRREAALETARSARDRVHRYLTDAIWVLGRTSDGLDDGGADRGEPSWLAGDIDRRLRAHAAALDEVEALL